MAIENLKKAHDSRVFGFHALIFDISILAIYIYIYMANQKKEKVLEFVKQALAGCKNKKFLQFASKQAKQSKQAQEQTSTH